jgi:hypothetical protein
LYGRICDSWRALIDVRFKLLALVPIVSGFGVTKVLEANTSLSPTAGTGLALIGLFATLGLLIYDLRNSELHDDLISRGRRIEDELGVDTGQFRGRLKASNWWIKHDNAMFIIYGASLLAWGFAISMVSTGTFWPVIIAAFVGLLVLLYTKYRHRYERWQQQLKLALQALSCRTNKVALGNLALHQKAHLALHQKAHLALQALSCRTNKVALGNFGVAPESPSGSPGTLVPDQQGGTGQLGVAPESPLVSPDASVPIEQQEATP